MNTSNNSVGGEEGARSSDNANDNGASMMENSENGQTVIDDEVSNDSDHQSVHNEGHASHYKAFNWRYGFPNKLLSTLIPPLPL